MDGANGVGAIKLLQLQKKLKILEMHIRNNGQDGRGILNLGVGADYVQKEKVLPENFDKTEDAELRYGFLWEEQNCLEFEHTICSQFLF